ASGRYCGRPLCNEVDRTPYCLGSVEGRGRTFHYLDTGDGQQVHLDHGVVIEDTHRPHRDAVFKVEEVRVGAHRLPYRHAMLLVVIVECEHAGYLVHHFGQQNWLRVVKGGSRYLVDRQGYFASRL